MVLNDFVSMHPDLFPVQILEDLINSSGLSKYMYDIDLQMEGAKDLNFTDIWKHLHSSLSEQSHC